MKNTLLLSALAVMLLASCKKEETQKLVSEEETTQKYDRIKELDWLVGKWRSHSAENISTETWEKQDDSTFTGFAFTLRGTDTIFSENIVLDQRGDSLHYVVTTANQNDQKPVSFTLKSFTANKYVFENLKHDFPTRIVYERKGVDSILASVSGEANGETTIVEFPMVRVK